MRNHSQEARAILSAVPYLKGLDSPAIDTIALAAQAQDYDSEQLVILEGEPASGLYIVQKGWLKASKFSIDGREQTLQVEDLSLRTVEACLARLLLEESSEESLPQKKWATQTEMAARLGTVPDVVSPILRKLADRGLIEIYKTEIRIQDRAE